MNIIFIGPPLSGKGTQSKLIIQKYHIPHISTGDIFRENIKGGTKLGLEAQAYIAKGEYVPDEITIGIVKDRLSKQDCKNGFLLDGFPRTNKQAEYLDNMLKESNSQIDIVLHLMVDEDELIKRVESRLYCPKCSATFNQTSSITKAKIHNICDYCATSLIKREDDNADSLKVRLHNFRKQTRPLLDYYYKKNIVVDINALQSIEKVFLDIDKNLSKL